MRTVDVRTDRPAFHGALAWWRKLARAFGLHHETTSPGLVRRFVSLDPGRACTEFRRSESERILRAQPYIADARVVTTRTADGVHVDVSTVDEVPVVGGARANGVHIRALDFGTMNFLGAGMHVEGRWEDGRTYRDGFGARVSHSQFLGRPYTIALDAMRHPIGEEYSIELGHAFLTDLQRLAWHADYGTGKGFVRLHRADRLELAQPVDRYSWNAGGVARFGPPRRLGLIGGTLLGERIAPRREFFVIDSVTDRLVPTMDTAGIRQYSIYDAAHIAGVFGMRALTFTRMHGLDALDAEEDVATGTQVGTLFGSHPFAGSLFRDGFGSLDVYVGSRTRRNFIGIRTEVESRLDVDKGDWRNLIASGRAAWYFKPQPRWTSELSIESAGGWRTIVPFQLELGDRYGGVRGYAKSWEAGGQRLLARIEQRVDLARYQGTRAAIGAAVFSDAGRMWACDVPFGVNTPVRASIGAALLAAVPAQSRRTIRAELAIPMSRSLGARPELRFTIREPARGFWSDPPQIRWAKLSAAAEELFSWP